MHKCALLTALDPQVPALRAKPGNPGTAAGAASARVGRIGRPGGFTLPPPPAGYGFRHARWRDTLADAADSTACEQVPPPPRPDPRAGSAAPPR